MQISINLTLRLGAMKTRSRWRPPLSRSSHRSMSNGRSDQMASRLAACPDGARFARLRWACAIVRSEGSTGGNRLRCLGHNQMNFRCDITQVFCSQRTDAADTLTVIFAKFCRRAQQSIPSTGLSNYFPLRYPSPAVNLPRFFP